MAVDLASEFAPPTQAPDQAQGIDLSSEFTAPPQQQQNAIINDAAEKAHQWKTADATGRLKLLLDSFGTHFTEETKKTLEQNWHDVNTPMANLPLAPSDVPDIPTPVGSMSMLAGAYNGIAPVISGFTSPLSIGTLGLFGGLTKAAQGFGPAATAAKHALTVLKTAFAAQMAKGAGAAAGEASVTAGKTAQQETTDVVSALTQGAMAALAGKSAIDDVAAPKSAEKSPSTQPANANPIQSTTPEVRVGPEPQASGSEVATGAPREPVPVAGASEAPKAQEAPVEPVPIGDRSGRPTGAAEDAVVAEQKRLIDEHLATQPKLADEFAPPEPGSEAHTVITEALDARAPVEPPPAETPPAEPPAGGITSIKNAVVDEERKARNLPPAMEPAAREFGTAWDEAAKRLNDNPNAGGDLVTEILDKPRALSDTDNAILLRHQIDLQNEFDKLTSRMADETASPEQRSVDQTRLAALSDDLLDTYNAGKLAGTETGRGLAARKMLANEDFSLAKMVTTRRAVNYGAELTPEQISETQALHDKINATQKAFDDYVAQTNERIAKMEKTRPGTRNTDRNVVSRYISEQADAARSRIKARMAEGRVNSGLDPAEIADHVLIAADYLSRGLEAGAELVKEFGERVRPHLDEILAKARERLPVLEEAAKKEQTRLKSFKTRTANATSALEEKVAAGDVSPKEKPSALVLDEEAQKLKAANERAKISYQTMLVKDRLAQRTLPERVQDTLVRWRRGFLLSGPGTLEKLTGAAFLRLITTPVEELVGSAIGKVVPQLMERAPRHGGLNVDAEAKAITAIFTKGMKDAYETLTTGKSNKDILFGRQGGKLRPSDVIPQSVIDLFANLHGALKAPVKASEFARSMEKRKAFAIRAGVDVNDPQIQQAMAVAAYKDANRAIFMQDNIASKMFNTAVSAAENMKVNGEKSTVGKALGTGLRVLFPIVKVPSNIVAEAAEYTVGSVTGSVQLAKAFRAGIEKLPPEQADNIARQLKKGSIGAAALLIGYYNRDSFGGFYQQGEKRKPGDIGPGDARLAGVDVGKHMIHSSLVETIQLGATVGRIQDEKIKGVNNSVSDSIGLATLGLAEQLPFVRTPIELSKLFDKNERGYAKGELVKDLVVPQAVSQVSQMLDKDTNGNPIKRKPKTVWEHIETGIPGLRKSVPGKNTVAPIIEK